LLPDPKDSLDFSRVDHYDGISIKSQKDMSRIPVIAGNWKMHKTIEESVAFIRALAPQVKRATNKIFITPPFTAISACAEAAKGTNVVIGAQNMSDADEGAFTGEISGKMLKEAGAEFVLLGHSERRSHFHETDLYIQHKLKRALLVGLTPILCIGENEQERAGGYMEKVLMAQIDCALMELKAEALAPLIIAYEPVWAIGTGKTATPEMAQEAHAMIRAHLAKFWDPSFSKRLPILYGGSVKPNNIKNLLNQPDIDGALIGGASLEVAGFAQMVMS
jgi:triosephosphate isomerase (TIM)